MSVDVDPIVNPVFILDDDQDRHDAFRHFYGNQGIPTVHATTVAGAIIELEKHVTAEVTYQAILLDHDLGDYKPNPDHPDGKWREFTGRDVVDWIVANLDPTKSPQIRVHSWNIAAAERMVNALHDRGFKVHGRPFASKEGVFGKDFKP